VVRNRTSQDKMDKMNLCIDIGNTSTKAAAYQDGELIAYHKPFGVEQLKEYKEEGAHILVSASGENSEIEAFLTDDEYLTHAAQIPIEIDYATPHTLGRDRIAAAVGAYAIDNEATWIIIDLGTCLTIDLLHKGVYLGGLISPGVQMRFKAMNEYTAGLPLVEQNYEMIFPGKTTEHSLQVGVCQSIGYEIEGYIRQMNERYADIKIVHCSSLHLDFGKEVKNEIFARPNLVVEGLNHILEYNAKK
jgi:type III pantothenate kinase